MIPLIALARSKASWYAIAALLLAVLALYVSGLRTRLAHATETATRLEAEASRQKANSALALRLSLRNAELAAERATRVASLEREVRDARKPVSAECVRAMEPVQRALDGLREFERDRSAALVVPEL